MDDSYWSSMRVIDSCGVVDGSIARNCRFFSHSTFACAILQVRRVRCESSACMVPKDKAVKRFVVRNIVDASAIRDLQDASTVENYQLPKVRFLIDGASNCSPSDKNVPKYSPALSRASSAS